MPTFRHLPISRRLWLIVLVAVAMLLAMSVLLLRQSYDDLYAGKVLKTQHVVESVQGILKHQHALQLSGKLSQEQAQQQAIALIRDLRYSQNDYFWINDLGPKMVMHAAKPELEGKELGGMKDPNGLPQNPQQLQQIVAEAVQQALDQAGVALKEREIAVKEKDADTKRMAVEQAGENKVLDTFVSSAL
mgnify:CR=1 FL=1